MKLFEGCLGYANGAQSRDFVYIDDVTAVLLHFLDKPVSGIYNCGTGRAQPFNDVALSVINSLRHFNNEPELSLQDAVDCGELEYIPFPEALKGKYQAFTEANLTQLRHGGCDVRFRTVQEGTRDYMEYLLKTFPRVE